MLFRITTWGSRKNCKGGRALDRNDSLDQHYPVKMRVAHVILSFPVNTHVKINR